MYSYTMLVNKKNKLKKELDIDLVMVGKRYSLKDIYLERKCRNAFNLMASKAYGRGYYLIANSGYRSFKEQELEIKESIENEGEEYTEKYVAKVGVSEHHTGLAIDIKSGDTSPFIISREYLWLKKNAFKFGFILRYPEGKEDITGYNFEPWHYRYVGKKVAKFITKNNMTLEEYIEKMEV